MNSKQKFWLFSSKKEIPKNKTIIPYLGKVYNNPAVGDYVFKVNNHKFINGYKSTSIGSFANSCRAVDQRAKRCSGNNASFSADKKSQAVNTKSIKNIKPDHEIFTSYGREYWKG